MRQAVIVGTGLYHPEKCVPNSYFDEFYKMEISSFLREKRNIHQRFFMSKDQATSDLIVPAVEMALKNANLAPADIDLLIVSTDTPDYVSPSTASVVQHKMKMINAGTFDVNSACAGFVTGLDIASKYLVADERYRNIVVVGAYGMSKYLNWDDYKIASLFADGAGAVVVQARDLQRQDQTAPGSKPGILASKLFTLGEYHDYMGIYAGGTHLPISQEVLDKKQHLLSFAKKIPLETNTTHWPQMAKIVLDRCQRHINDVKLFFLTQINIGTIEATMDALGVSRDLSYNIMDRFGYTGSACLPMALADAALKHRLKKGDLIMLVGSGGGVAMGAVAIEWAYDT